MRNFLDLFQDAMQDFAKEHYRQTPENKKDLYDLVNAKLCMYLIVKHRLYELMNQNSNESL